MTTVFVHNTSLYSIVLHFSLRYFVIKHIFYDGIIQFFLSMFRSRPFLGVSLASLKKRWKNTKINTLSSVNLTNLKQNDLYVSLQYEYLTGLKNEAEKR